MPADFVPEQELSFADWLLPRFREPVADIGPQGFSAYVRVCHPVERDGRTYSWAEVARETGRVAHPLMQWHALVGASDSLNMSDSIWPGTDPRCGELELEALSALCAVLGRYTTTAQDCLLGVWEGYGFIDGGSAMVFVPEGSGLQGEIRPVAAAFSRDAPTLTLWGRNYFVFRGSLATAIEMSSRWRQPPNVVWPADQAWFLGSEIDFDSTVIAGSEPLARALLDADDVDAWPIQTDASLTASADKINAVPPAR